MNRTAASETVVALKPLLSAARVNRKSCERVLLAAIVEVRMLMAPTPIRPLLFLVHSSKIAVLPALLFEIAAVRALFPLIPFVIVPRVAVIISVLAGAVAVMIVVVRS